MSENHSEMLQEHSEMLQETRTLDIVAAEIRSYTWSMLTNIIEIGRRLVEAKEMLPHGEFMSWCTENFGYSKSQTNNFMRLYEAYGSEQNSMFGAELNRQTFGTLNYSKALALLALPSAEEREAFIEENNVDEMTTRELQQAIKEKQEAERKLGDEKKQREEAEDLLKTQDQMLVEARAQIEELAKLNKELENRPHEVAVETVRDEEAIAAAAKEAREKAEAEAEKQSKDYEKQIDDILQKLKKAEKERDKLKKQAETAGSDTDAKIAAAEAEAARIRAELEEAQKKLKASSADVAKFGVWFTQVQNDFNRMMEALREVRERDPETGEKLKTGAVTLLKNLLERMAPEAES